MNNWGYANKLQTPGYFGQLSVTRELKLQVVNGIPVLLNSPVPAINTVFTSVTTGSNQIISDSMAYKFPAWNPSAASRIDFTLSPTNGKWPAAVFLSVRGGSNYFTQIAFDMGKHNVFIKRDTGGPAPVGDSLWSNNYNAPFDFDAPVKVSVLVDAGSIEVFLNGGQVSMSELITAPISATSLNLTDAGGSASISGLTIRSVS